jgi:hypothetical protein
MPRKVGICVAVLGACAMLLSMLGAGEAATKSSAKSLLNPASVERMNSFSFMDAYEKRGGDMSEDGQDQAALYYASVKRSLHDRQARKVSAACLRKLQWIRRLLTEAETEAFAANRRPGVGSHYVHMQTRWCMEREDALGSVMKSFWATKDSDWSKGGRLGELAALDTWFPTKTRPYHKLAKAIAGLRDPAIEIIFAHEQSTAGNVETGNPGWFHSGNELPEYWQKIIRAQHH